MLEGMLINWIAFQAWFIALITCRSSARNCYNSKKAKIWFKYNTLRLKNNESYVILFISSYNIIVTGHNFCYNVVKFEIERHCKNYIGSPTT